MKLEFFYDIASPYTYLASTRVDAVGASLGLPVVWRPFLLGAVFKATGNTMPAAVPAKGTWMLADLDRWARLYGVPFRMPSDFPQATLGVQRLLTATGLAHGHDAQRRLASELFAAVWGRGQSAADLVVSQNALRAAELPQELLVAAGEEAAKVELRTTTDEAVARGAFGAPAIFVGDALFFGNDRFELIAHEVARVRAEEAR